MLFGIGIVFLFLVSVGISYEYFSSTITNKDVKEQVVETGTLEASYEIFWQELNNEITNDEMVMSATCERLNSNSEVDDACEGIDETSISCTSIKKNITV